MKLKIVMLSAVVALSGCALKVPTITDVNCTATYAEKTFPYSKYILKLNKKKDGNKKHQNVVWYKPAGLSPVKFAGGWAPESALEDIQCQTSE